VVTIIYVSSSASSHPSSPIDSVVKALSVEGVAGDDDDDDLPLYFSVLRTGQKSSLKMHKGHCAAIL
jgi:hypothetical protein